MSNITWALTDRATGQTFRVPHPTTKAEREALMAGLQGVTKLGVRGGALNRA